MSARKKKSKRQNSDNSQLPLNREKGMSESSLTHTVEAKLVPEGIKVQQTGAGLIGKSEEDFSRILENAGDIIYRYQLVPEPKFVYVSPASTKIVGYTPEEHYADPLLGIKLVHPDDRHFLEQLRAGHSDLNHRQVFRWIKKDGNIIWTEQHNVGIYDETGQLIAIEGIARDVSERKQVEEALRQSEERYRELFENANDVIYVHDIKGRILSVNKAAERVFGYTGDYLTEMNFLQLVASEYHELVKRITRKQLADALPANYELIAVNKAGDRIFLEISARLMYENGEAAAIQGIARDITERKKMEEKLRFLSLHDSLTGLYNRNYFNQEFSRLEDGRNDPVGIIVCDVDGLKLVNDNLGHSAGDLLLKTIADIMKMCFRQGDVVARIGGDEFGVILLECSKEALEEAAQRFRVAVSNYNCLNPGLSISISIGWAVRIEPSQKLIDLYKQADNNMYQDKLHNRENIRRSSFYRLLR